MPAQEGWRHSQEVYMGTNYYAKDKKVVVMPAEESIHIGKRSSGWRFMFHLHKDYYKDYNTLIDWLRHKDIYDEYGNRIPLKEFEKIVKEVQNGQAHEGAAVIDGYDFYEGDFC